MSKKQIYSWQLTENIHKQIPEVILKSLLECGWNVYGIYELVKREIKKEKIRANGNVQAS